MSRETEANRLCRLIIHSMKELVEVYRLLDEEQKKEFRHTIYQQEGGYGKSVIRAMQEIDSRMEKLSKESDSDIDIEI